MSSSLYASQTTLLLIRHGETDWNKEKRAQGQTDIPLNSTGINQAKNTAIQIKATYPKLSAIYSSDLVRASRTAQFTAQQYHLPIIKRPALREIYRGEAEGRTREEIFKKFDYKKAAADLKLKYPNRKERWTYTIIPNEESLSDLEQRIRKELLEICHTHQGKTIAIFFHGTAIKTFIASIKECEIDEIHLPNCAVVKVDFDSENSLQPFSPHFSQDREGD